MFSTGHISGPAYSSRWALCVLFAKLALQYSIQPLFNEAQSLKALPKPRRISELNSEKNGFVFLQTILSNSSINLTSEYAVALGHYTIPFEIKQSFKST